MKIVFLDTKTIGDIPELALLNNYGEVVLYPTTSAEQTSERVADAEVIITNKVRIGEEIINNAPKLKLICVAATGMNNIDLVSAEKKGVQVKNVMGYSTDIVAQHTFAMLFSLVHHLHYYNQYVHSGQYSQNDIFSHFDKPFYELRNKTFGIIGLGAIGRRVAEIASIFGCNIIYHSVSGKNTQQAYKHVGLDELLSLSDIVSIHAPLNKETYNLLAYDRLEKMKRQAYLINTGRGGIIDEAALCKALEQDLIAGAALDVFEQEPLPADSPLLSIKQKHKLLLTPHIAWAGSEARGRLMKGIVENIKEFLNS